MSGTFKLILLCLILSAASAAYAQAPMADVPFVGCKSDGQTGPLPAPKAPAKPVRVDAGAAQRLAYYKAENGPGVLAPRGWSCFGFYGSNGTVLLVTPNALPSSMLESLEGTIAGPAIQLTESSGETSGRFEVARIAARVFPARMNIVRQVIAEGIVPASEFPFGPYPTDRLVRKSDTIVEFETPARLQGLGTHSRLAPNGDPIRGVAILENETPDLLLLAVRLPANLADLAPRIIGNLSSEVP